MTITWTQETFEQLAAGFTSWRSFLDQYPGAQSAQRSGKIDPWQVWRRGGGIKSQTTGNPYEANPDAIWDAPEEDQLIESNWRPFAVRLSNQCQLDGLSPEQLEDGITKQCRFFVENARNRFNEARAIHARVVEQIKITDTDVHIQRINRYAADPRFNPNDIKLQAILTELKSRNLPPFVVEMINPVLRKQM